jgi:hypothetical protein
MMVQCIHGNERKKVMNNELEYEYKYYPAWDVGYFVADPEDENDVERFDPVCNGFETEDEAVTWAINHSSDFEAMLFIRRSEITKAIARKVTVEVIEMDNGSVEDMKFDFDWASDHERE